MVYSNTNTAFPEGQNLEVSLKPTDRDSFAQDTTIALEGSILTASGADGSLREVGITHNANALSVQKTDINNAQDFAQNFTFTSQTGETCWRHANTQSDANASNFDLSAIWKIANLLDGGSVSDASGCLDLAEPANEFSAKDLQSVVNVVFWTNMPDGSNTKTMQDYINAWVKAPDENGPPEMIMTKIQEYFPTCSDTTPCVEVTSAIIKAGLDKPRAAKLPKTALPDLGQGPRGTDGKGDMLQ